jgi:hypothetical protein
MGSNFPVHSRAPWWPSPPGPRRFFPWQPPAPGAGALWSLLSLPVPPPPDSESAPTSVPSPRQPRSGPHRWPGCPGGDLASAAGTRRRVTVPACGRLRAGASGQDPTASDSEHKPEGRNRPEGAEMLVARGPTGTATDTQGEFSGRPGPSPLALSDPELRVD